MKDKVIHTRVSEELFRKVSDKARKHRMSCSNLIRNMLEDGIEIYNDVADIVDERVEECLTDEPIGVQPITLLTDKKCDRCGKPIKKGKPAHIEIYKNSSRKTLCCTKCLKR